MATILEIEHLLENALLLTFAGIYVEILVLWALLWDQSSFVFGFNLEIMGTHQPNTFTFSVL